jgi:iron complex outermembrane receptor protein
MNGMLQNNLNKGDEYLIPDYNLTDCGAFVTGRKSFGKADLSGGFRFDLRNQLTEELFLDTEGNPVEAESVNSIKKFDSFSKLFTGFSGGIGISYEVSSSVYGKLNLAKGYRAPNIAELTSNGEHEGTFRYEIGNNKLKPESNWQIDFAFGVNTDHITLELDLFSNHIDHFIFSEKISGASGSDSTIDGLSVFQYTSGNALLKGGEFVLDIHPHPLDWLHFQNTISLVNATQKSQPDSTRYLPRIPAPKISTEIHAEFDKQWLICKKSYLKVEMENYLKQDKIYEAYQTETATPGYTLVHIGFGTSIMRGSNTLFSLYASLNNITNVAYQNHLSRLKYAPENFATGRTGIYNMGRNFSIKLLFPFDLKKN